MTLEEADEDDLKLWRIFNPELVEKMMGATANRTRLVHYTTADTATKIIQNREVWLRKSSCMNDFMEIEHGLAVLKHVYDTRRAEITAIFDYISEGALHKLTTLFDAWQPHFREDTYITCLSEHAEDEDFIGRLSMWRAYGGDAGVALVLNPTVFFSLNDALGAYSSPVTYATPEGYLQHFDAWLGRIQDNADFFKSKDPGLLIKQGFEKFQVIALCTKHPGFHEEREWRVMHVPKMITKTPIKKKIRTVGATPQPVCVLPLQNIPDESLFGMDIKELLDRVIIGPATYPLVIKEAFVELMKAAGVQDAERRVVLSDIPLRR